MSAPQAPTTGLYLGPEDAERLERIVDRQRDELTRLVEEARMLRSEVEAVERGEGSIASVGADDDVDLMIRVVDEMLVAAAEKMEAELASARRAAAAVLAAAIDEAGQRLSAAGLAESPGLPAMPWLRSATGPVPMPTGIELWTRLADGRGAGTVVVSGTEAALATPTSAGAAAGEVTEGASAHGDGNGADSDSLADPASSSSGFDAVWNRFWTEPTSFTTHETRIRPKKRYLP